MTTTVGCLARAEHVRGIRKPLRDKGLVKAISDRESLSGLNVKRAIIAMRTFVVWKPVFGVERLGLDIQMSEVCVCRPGEYDTPFAYLLHGSEHLSAIPSRYTPIIVVLRYSSYADGTVGAAAPA